MKLERLIVADDHVLVREGMRTLLEGNRTSMWCPRQRTVKRPWSSAESTARIWF